MSKNQEGPLIIIYPIIQPSTNAADVGYITGMNEMTIGKEEYLRMKFSEVASWVTSWYRDNPSRDISEVMDALYDSRNCQSIP